jgi:iron(III) transport system substrate-binding protein
MGSIAVGFVAGRSSGAGKMAPAAELALIAAARKEGKLHLYTGTDESVAVNLGKVFQQKYGVALGFERLHAAELELRYPAEMQSGKAVADVLLTGDRMLLKSFQQKGWLARLDTSAIPGLGDWPRHYRDDYGAIVTINPFTIALNTTLMLEPPNDWNYLLRPELKGKLLTLDLMKVNLEVFVCWNLMRKQYGDEFLKKISRQIRFVSTGPEALEQVVSGAGMGWFPCTKTQAETLFAQGKPIKSFLPQGAPCTGVMSPVSISAGAPHPNAARLFTSFMLTPDGQKILNDIASSPNNTPGTAPMPSGFVQPDHAAAAANRARIIQLLTT